MKITANTYRVEYMGLGGSWGSHCVCAETPKEAEEKLARAEFVDTQDGKTMPKATHVSQNGRMIRVKL